jgi:hypothetical protein
MGLAFIAALIVLLGGIAIVRRVHADGPGPSIAPVASSARRAAGSDGTSDGVIYDDSMGKGWEAPGWSWAKDVNYASTDAKFSGATSIRIHLKVYEGVKLHHDGPIALDHFDRLSFHVRAGANGLSGLRVLIGKDGARLGTFMMELAPTPAQQWMTVSIPLAKYGLPANSGANEIWLQSFAASDVHFYVDDVRLLSAGDADPEGQLVNITPQQ